MAGLNDRVRREIEQLLAARRKIDAIKRLRQETGLGLAEAKAAVEDWPAWSAGLVSMPSELDERAWRQIDALVADGKKIHAIKLYREQTGAALKEAVDALDARSGKRTARTPLGETGRLSQRSTTPPTKPLAESRASRPERDSGPAAVGGNRPQTVRAGSSSAQGSHVQERSAGRHPSPTAAAPGAGDHPGSRQPAPTLDNQRLREIERHLFAGQKRRAIAALREVTGLGLHDARQQVDAIEATLRAKSPQMFQSRSKLGCGTTVLMITIGISTAGGLAIWLSV